MFVWRACMRARARAWARAWARACVRACVRAFEGGREGKGMDGDGERADGRTRGGVGRGAVGDTCAPRVGRVCSPLFKKPCSRRLLITDGWNVRLPPVDREASMTQSSARSCRALGSSPRWCSSVGVGEAHPFRQSGALFREPCRSHRENPRKEPVRWYPLASAPARR